MRASGIFEMILMSPKTGQTLQVSPHKVDLLLLPMATSPRGTILLRVHLTTVPMGGQEEDHRTAVAVAVAAAAAADRPLVDLAMDSGRMADTFLVQPINVWSVSYLACPTILRKPRVVSTSRTTTISPSKHLAQMFQSLVFNSPTLL